MKKGDLILVAEAAHEAVWYGAVHGGRVLTSDGERVLDTSGRFWPLAMPYDVALLGTKVTNEQRDIAKEAMLKREFERRELVLVRNDKDRFWSGRRFEKLAGDDEPPLYITTDGYQWHHCIPFNINLMGTNGEPA